MIKLNALILFSSISLLLFGFQTVYTNTSTVPPSSSPEDVRGRQYYDSDNTGKNVRDRNSTAVTPFDQNENKVDLSITQDIRKAIMADKTLSTDAKNIKVISENGNVILRGPVANTNEIKVIMEKVKSVKGVNKIDNHLEVIQRK